jgi:3D (Asp-Asp-Asp) domain-containing protein
MNKSLKKSILKLLFLTFSVAIFGILFESHLVFGEKAENNALTENLIRDISENLDKELVISQENSLLSISNPNDPEPRLVETLTVTVTAYSSTVLETDESPYFTASGAHVRDGTVASNLLPFGTKIKIPELYGDKTFVVEDRLHWSAGKDKIDIWFPSYQEALNFGVKKTYIEIFKG